MDFPISHIDLCSDLRKGTFRSVQMPQASSRPSGRTLPTSPVTFPFNPSVVASTGARCLPRSERELTGIASSGSLPMYLKVVALTECNVPCENDFVGFFVHLFLAGDIPFLSSANRGEKYSSNVVEKCFEIATVGEHADSEIIQQARDPPRG